MNGPISQTLCVPTAMKSLKILFPLVILVCIIGPVSAQSTSLDDVLAAMSLRQKVGQMFVATFYGPAINEPARLFLQGYQPGAVVFLPSNLENPNQIARLTNDIQQTLRDAGTVPAFIGVDQEGGIIAHLEQGFTRWPVPMLLTATGDAELAYSVGMAYAQEMQAVGINMNLAPVADLYTNPDNPIIGRRSFGAFPGQVAPIVAAFAQGMQSGGVLAVAKHFPGHGDTSADSHVTLPVISHDMARLTTTELVPFSALAQANVGGIMTAHIYFSALEPETGMPGSLSGAIVTDLLRDQLGYDGLIVTDALDMDAIDTVFSPAEAALMAIEAGSDWVLTGAHVSPDAQAAAIEAVVAAVESGEIDEARIDASVRRILTAKQNLGVLDAQPVDAFLAADAIDLEAHAELISQMFAEGTAIAYGEESIPVQSGALTIYPASQPSLWNACAQGGSYQPLGISDRPTADEIAWARSAASTAEQVVVFTRNLEENAQLAELVNGLPLERTVVVALHSPEDWRYIPRPQAYMMTYSPLPAAYEPVCRILSGQLPATGQVVINMDI